MVVVGRGAGGVKEGCAHKIIWHLGEESRHVVRLRQQAFREPASGSGTYVGTQSGSV